MEVSPRIMPVVMMVWMAGLLGCGATLRPTSQTPATAPADFALVVTLTPPDASMEHPPHLHAAQYVLEPDGTLRAALGPGSHAGLLPPVTARLDPGELDGLWRLAAPLLPTALPPQPADIRLDLAITAAGRTTRGLLPADAAEPLLRRLAELRGDGS